MKRAHGCPSAKYDSYPPYGRSMRKSGVRYSASKLMRLRRASRTTTNVRLPVVSQSISYLSWEYGVDDTDVLLDFADMIIDNDPPITRHISVPRDMSQLSCSALTAGIVEAVLDGLGFVSVPLSRLVSSIDAHGFVLLSPHALRPIRYRQSSIRNARPSSSSSTNPSWSGKKPSNSPNTYKLQHPV